MRFAVLLMAVLVGVAAFWLLGDPAGPMAPDDQSGTRALGPAPVTPTAESAGGNQERDDDLPVPVAEVLDHVPGEDLSAGSEEDPERMTELDLTGMDLVDFHGTVWIQPKGQTPSVATRGTIEISVLQRGRMKPLTAQVQQGKFQVEVPSRCRLRVDGGRLEDQTVRFLGFPGPFSLDDSVDYALVGEPIPVNKLRVFEGTQGVPIAGITIRRGEDATTARSRDQDPVGEVLIENAASPVELPFLPADHPIWLHVSVPGYATTAVLVDPRESETKDVTLWPEACLTVRVTGPQRAKLKALILHRLEPGEPGAAPSKRHFATFGMNAPGISRDPDAVIFELEGLPALPLRLEARGFDDRGRETLLGKTSIELGPSETKTVELRTVKD